MSQEHAIPESPSHLVSGLLKEHAVRSGRIEAALAALQKERAELGIIDNAIKVLAPNLKIEGIKAKRHRSGPRQNTTAPVLAILCEAEQPLAAREIADRVLVGRGVNLEDQQAAQMTLQQVQQALTNLSKQGIVKAASDRRPKAWSVV